MLFGHHIKILVVFPNSQIGRKIVKNHGLTLSLFGEGFRPSKLTQILV